MKDDIVVLSDIHYWDANPFSHFRVKVKGHTLDKHLQILHVMNQ